MTPSLLSTPGTTGRSFGSGVARSSPADFLDRLAAIADGLGLVGLEPPMRACRDLLQAHARLDVAVFGRFKAGKSSLLNQLVGGDVLPVGAVPVTAVITRLFAGPAERVEVQFQNGTRRAIAPGEIENYVSETRNAGNARNVAAVDITLPSLEGLAPLRLVDTPGVDSALAHNTATTRDWLPNVGAALLAVSADAPLSEQDLGLLRELRRHTPKVVVLLTKADLLSERQRREVVAYVRRRLEEVGAGPTPIHLYSVRPGEAGLRARFQAEVLHPLLRGRGDTATQIVRHKLDLLTRQTLDYARVALAAATRTESARQALREGLAGEHRQFALLRAECATVVMRWSANALDESLERLQPVQLALQRRTTEDLRAQFARWPRRLPAVLRRWREWMREYLVRELTEISRAEAAAFREPVDRTREHLGRTLRGFHARLASQVRAALGVALAPAEFELETIEPAAPPVDVEFAFSAGFELVAPLLPFAPLRRPVERSLLRKARYEAEKNVSRLAAAWRDRTAKAMDALVRQAEARARDDLASLEGLLERTGTGEPHLRAWVVELTASLHLPPLQAPTDR